ncbi:brother of CDO [Protopterus annectens]|uniref:brother of CDO n=1 Tax=Protopterus annectens TaxID=7888 RepID=UPI001CFAB081|nr:brother of CDO [Protopterus annectens]
MGLRWKVSTPALWLILCAFSRVVYSDDIPYFRIQPKSAVQKLGGSVMLECAAEPATANVSWRLNDRELNSHPDVLIYDGTLVVTSVSNETVGRYQCVVRTALGAVASLPAIVTLAKLQDFKTDSQQVIEVDEGNTAVIACNLPESQPKAQVRYNVKQEWLEVSKGNYLIMPSGNLQIVNATQEDEGTYKCAAYNPVTQEVKTSSSIDRLRVRRSTAEAARIIYPPKPQTIIVTKGQNLILECVASGIPPPQVTWAKDGIAVQPHNNTQFLLSNLLINGTSESDSGTYSCMADNGIGEMGAVFTYYSVQVFEPPEVSIQLQQSVVHWGQTVKFSCNVRGNPPPSVIWLCNAVPLVESRQHHISNKVLRVSSVGPDDEGIYQCMAENEVGRAQAATLLIATGSGTVGMPPTNGGDISQLSHSLKQGSSENAVAVPRPTAPPVTPSICSGQGAQVLPAEAPVILSSPRTSKADLYELTWRPRPGDGAAVIYYIVKHRKHASESPDNWTVSHIPGNQHRFLLTKLDPSSLYEVEMAPFNCAGEGQAAMMTFRTGNGRSPGKKCHIPGCSRPQVEDDGCIKSEIGSQSGSATPSCPEAPDRPTVSMASETSVYVTWIPRGNGGFPIMSFRVEYKKLGKGEDWALARSDIPPSRLSVEIPGLQKGTSYKFRVRAVNVLGDSPPSAASKPYAVFPGPTRPEEGPYITFTEAINETTIMLKWMYTPSTNSSPIHGFYIYYRPTDSDNDSDYKKDMVEGERYWHSITNLQPETSYDIKMRCYNKGGESEFSNVMICETKARKVVPGQTAVLPAPTSSGSNSNSYPAGISPRSSDLPYLIVGVVLGSLVLLIVTFVPFCLWRAWAKQKQAADLAFPSSILSTASCQYTMVPLQGVLSHAPNGLPLRNGINAAFNGGNYTYAVAKHLEYSPGSLPLEKVECDTLLEESVVRNGSPGQCLYSESPPVLGSTCLYSLPDDSTHELLHSHECSCAQEELGNLLHMTESRATATKAGLARDHSILPGLLSTTGLTPVEEIEHIGQDCASTEETSSSPIRRETSCTQDTHSVSYPGPNVAPCPSLSHTKLLEKNILQCPCWDEK